MLLGSNEIPNAIGVDRKTEKRLMADLFYFELAWEVCHKQGGIYTFIRHKSSHLTLKLSHYYLIGPYLPDRRDNLFCPMKKPAWLEQLCLDIGQEVVLHYGCWDIHGKPKVILVETTHLTELSCSNLLQKDFSLDSLLIDNNFLNDELKFADALSLFFMALQKQTTINVKELFFHEWQASCVIPYLRKYCPSYKTIFETHATQLGRIAANLTPEQQTALQKKDLPEWAHHNQWLKHCLEKKIAETASLVYVTSDSVGAEVENLWDCKPDKVTRAGLNYKELVNFSLSKDKINELRQRIYSYFSTPTESYTEHNTCLILIAARYEYLNKGFDIYLKALGELNKRKRDKKIVAIIISSQLRKINHVLTEAEREVSFLGEPKYYLGEDNPSTKSPIIENIHKKNLNNISGSHVKILYLPEFPEKLPSILGDDYYRIVTSMDLAIYPSLYEPWGYTGQESLSFGIPTVVSNTSGFGEYLQLCQPQLLGNGAYIIDRKTLQLKEQVQQLADYIDEVSRLTVEEMYLIRERAQKAMRDLDWDQLIRLEDYE